ncbi:MAG TPA: BadF/BadG/BcrA/BcrD ATPase family protein [Steroidobacteraceae bacterium]
MVKTYLGVDGGGTKTEFVLIDESGSVLARHQEGSAYYLEIGLDGLRAMLARGIGLALDQASLPAASLSFAFFGLPAYGEDSQLAAILSTVPSPTLEPGRYQCGNDMVCGWAGALACHDGINIVAGTGSIAYGELAGRQARAGGWGELFSDEGSAHWIAREGLSLFSRMSDGRAPKGPLLDLLRAHFNLASDLDICGAIYGSNSASRRNVAQLSSVIAAAARNGDAQARALFAAGAKELVAIVDATRVQLRAPAELRLPVSYSGGMFKLTDLVLEPFLAALSSSVHSYNCLSPRLPPAAGAALYAAKTFGSPLTESAIAALKQQL